MKREKKRTTETTEDFKATEKEYWCNVHQMLCEDVGMDLEGNDYCNMDCGCCPECEER